MSPNGTNQTVCAFLGIFVSSWTNKWPKCSKGNIFFLPSWKWYPLPFHREKCDPPTLNSPLNCLSYYPTPLSHYAYKPFDKLFCCAISNLKIPSCIYFFNACIFQNYLSKTLTSLSCSLKKVFPWFKMLEHLCFCYCKFVNLHIISTSVLDYIPQAQGYIKGPLLPQ
jgi:hypothetical protein